MDLATNIKKALSDQGYGASIHGKGDLAGADSSYSETKACLASLFQQGHGLIALCASGIVIRALASDLDDKFDEPPVLSVSRDGTSIVPLLGGHHGANEVADLLAEKLSAHAAITTAGDCRFKLALDNPPKGWALQNARAAGPLMARLVDGEALKVDPVLTWLTTSELTLSEDAPLQALSSIKALAASDEALVYSPKSLAIGLGCERGVASEHVIELIEGVLSDHGLAQEAIGCLCSIDLKSDEAALQDAARHFGVPVRFFPADRLNEEKARLANPSDVVFSEVGCHGVAEGSALAAIGQSGTLLVEKVKTDKATCAIGQAVAPLEIEQIGAQRGRLAVVGIGPGQTAWRTPEASRLVQEAEELVGYGLYIDLLGSLADGKKRSDFPLGGEEDRCRYALEEAAKGKSVALICSGDAGIYAMGALVMELMDRAPDQGGVSDLAKRVEIINAPGISALQAASARFGALLGHDFCTISLSDLLTPWEAIENRLHAAAKGDFVVAFYNPVSMRRRTQLAEAKKILLHHRPADTPVLLASNLGRPTEALRLRTLAELEVDEVDMLTVVLVGSSQSKAFKTGDRSVGDQGWRVYTPRGYAKKIDAAS
ncbi:MAG: precorrin-3B C(17)-methyltransferase [Cohaesibacter sp.]|nr:precorrin-3B C(17)-methyltransferase [Cohaesibacter sp.]